MKYLKNYLTNKIYHWYIVSMEAGDLLVWRKRLGLTQKELADLLGVRNMTVYRWECGMRAISPYLHLALEALENRLRKEGTYGPTNGVPGV